MEILSACTLFQFERNLFADALFAWTLFAGRFSFAGTLSAWTWFAGISFVGALSAWASFWLVFAMMV